MLGRADGVFESFYAITAQRRHKKPSLAAILENAPQRLFDILEPNGDGER